VERLKALKAVETQYTNQKHLQLRIFFKNGEYKSLFRGILIQTAKQNNLDDAEAKILRFTQYLVLMASSSCLRVRD